MDITRDLFLTDARAPYFTIALASRDIDAHRLLTGLTRAEHERIQDALASAAATIADTLKAAHARRDAHRDTRSLDCGT